MADNKVKFLRGTSNEYTAAEKDNDAIYFTTDDGKLYIGDKEVSGDGSITIDATLSDTSTNPVQNKVVKQAIDNKADKTTATTETAGLMSAEDKSKLDSADDTYALKSKYGDTTINVGRKADTDVGIYSTAEGYQTTASNSGSHAGGYQSIASGICSYAEGYQCIASGDWAYAEGGVTTASGNGSHAEGSNTTASGVLSHSEGFNTTASGNYSHAEGYSTNRVYDVIPDLSSSTSNDDIIAAWRPKIFSLAKETASHSEGYNTLALNTYSHAEGRVTIASGDCAHAEGDTTIASGNGSHAEGGGTTASGKYSHAEGGSSTARGEYAHAEGCSTASGEYSHAEGWSTTASGTFSHTGGYSTKALHRCEVAYGSYNVSNDDTLFSIGDGTADDARHNAFEITTTGGKLHDKNIATAENIPNPNLLINPDFKINQRGLTTYSGTSAYSVDHWFRNSEATMNVTENGVTLTYSGINNPSIYQKIENTKNLLGKTLTFSACINGIIYSCTNTLPLSLTEPISYWAFSRLDGEISTPNNTIPHIRMQILSSDMLICVLNNVSGCEWTKLEIGNTATSYSPPEPITELIKCQRYYQRISGAYSQIATGFLQHTGLAATCLPIPQQMRINPSTVTLVGKVYIWYKSHIAASSVVSTSIVTPIKLSQSTASIGFYLDEVANAEDVGMPCLAQFRDDTSYIEFNAEL